VPHARGRPAPRRGARRPLQQWFDAGLRSLQLAYNASHDEPNTRPENRLAGGCDEPEQGLTELGRAAVAELNRLGIVIDVSHCSKKTTLEVAALTRQPITANHANARALTDHQRNKDDEEIAAIAATGGVIGINTVGWMLDRDGDGEAGLDDFVAHVEHAIAIVGIEHVGIASDAHLDGWPELSRHRADAQLAALERWTHVARALHAGGRSLDDLAAVLGGNFVRVYDRVLPAAPR
jgi:membrane dipeptidase